MGYICSGDRERNKMKRIKNLIRNINYLSKHSLWDRREEDIVYLTNKILSDAVYEFDLDVAGVSKLRILDQMQSLEAIRDSNKSFVRTGDGEVKIMMGMDQPFQKYEQEIADRLIRLLENPGEDILVGINRNYFVPLMTKGNAAYYRRNAYSFRNFYLEHCNPDATYIDATCTSYPIGCGDTEDGYNSMVYEYWRKLFAGKHIAVVCGKGILDSLKYDIFALAESKKMIEGPKRHAWDEHDALISRIKREVSKEQLIVFILGMAGKAMIPELTDMGYVCWDVGHLAKYYNAYKTNLPGTKENIARFYAPD